MTLIGKVYPAKKRIPVINPFILVGHHIDNYPEGKMDMSPATTPTNWRLGEDFGSDRGYNMYHGSKVPGFPSHPHRGFETITYARRGFIDHFDSLGNSGRYGNGDVQWMTSGKGMQHAEMFPLLNTDKPNPFEIVQIWFNLPAKFKMVDPVYKMIWNETIPMIPLYNDNPTKNYLKLIMGSYGSKKMSPINENSWATDANNHVNIWEVAIEKGNSFTIPRFPDDIKAQVYVMNGKLSVEGYEVDQEHLLIYSSDTHTVISALEDTTLMVFVGREIQETVAAYGPFVMNTQEEIMQAYKDFEETEFGGWPWPSSEPSIDRLKGRFSSYGGGKFEQLPPQE